MSWEPTNPITIVTGETRPVSVPVLGIESRSYISREVMMRIADAVQAAPQEWFDQFEPRDIPRLQYMFERIALAVENR